MSSDRSEAGLFTRTEAAEYRRRRRALMRLMGSDSIAIIPAAPGSVRSKDSQYPYRPHNNLLYLTGLDEPESMMVLIPGRRAGEYILFLRDRDPEKETWSGRRLGVDAAPEALGADDAFPIADIDDILPGLLEDKQAVYHTLGKDQHFDVQLLNWLKISRRHRRDSGGDPDAFISLDYHLHEMRLFKSRHEIARMKKAAQVTSQAHRRAMLACRAGMFEYELEAELIHEYTRSGGTHAFEPIVAGGENACILHYVSNRDKLRDGDLVLVDSGAEIGYYAADITRTFPVSGRFTEAQRAVYDIVLEAQQAAIAAIGPGRGWNEFHDAAVRVLTLGLRELGLIKGRLPQLIKDEAFKPWYMHRTGHWLGMDVHDVGDYRIDGEWRELEAGMVMTVEPGLYLPDVREVPKALRGIGVRIEDNVVVTADGADVITDAVPTAAEDIEALMAERQ